RDGALADRVEMQTADTYLHIDSERGRYGAPFRAKVSDPPSDHSASCPKNPDGQTLIAESCVPKSPRMFELPLFGRTPVRSRQWARSRSGGMVRNCPAPRISDPLFAPPPRSKGHPHPFGSAPCCLSRAGSSR